MTVSPMAIIARRELQGVGATAKSQRGAQHAGRAVRAGGRLAPDRLRGVLNRAEAAAGAHSCRPGLLRRVVGPSHTLRIDARVSGPL